MPLSKSNQDLLAKLIENAVMKANEPIIQTLNELHQTVHGTKEEPGNGLASRVVKVEVFQKTMLYIFTIFTAIGSTLTFLILTFRSFKDKIL